MAASPNLDEVRIPGDVRGALGSDMDSAQFRHWARLLEDRTGIVLPVSRKAFLTTNLRMRMRELGLTDFDDYLVALSTGEDAHREWSVLVDRLTVQQTRFFRHQPSYDLVETQALPEFIAGEDKHFNMWSLGCATGEEAYSLAMIAARAIARADRRIYFGLTASDVSRPALAVGRTGIYHNDRLTEIPEDLQRQFCRALDAQHFVVADVLRKRVAFAVLNALELDRSPMTDLHLIFCQNMLIYFARERRHQILDQLAERLAPGGIVITGPGETTGWKSRELERLDHPRVVAYRRPTGDPS